MLLPLGLGGVTAFELAAVLARAHVLLLAPFRPVFTLRPSTDYRVHAEHLPDTNAQGSPTIAHSSADGRGRPDDGRGWAQRGDDRVGVALVLRAAFAQG